MEHLRKFADENPMHWSEREKLARKHGILGEITHCALPHGYFVVAHSELGRPVYGLFADGLYRVDKDLANSIKKWLRIPLI